MSAFSALCLLPAACCLLVSCRDTRDERLIHPDTARRELFLRGHVYKEEDFLTSAEEGDVTAVKLFLIAGMKPEVRNADAETPLMLAAKNGHVKAAQALLDRRRRRQRARRRRPHAAHARRHQRLGGDRPRSSSNAAPT